MTTRSRVDGTARRSPVPGIARRDVPRFIPASAGNDRMFPQDQALKRPDWFDPELRRRPDIETRGRHRGVRRAIRAGKRT